MDFLKKFNNNIDRYLDFSKNKKKVLVIGSGGVNGISILGAIKSLEEKKLLNNLDIIAGSSAGSIIGCLISIGYKSEDLLKEVKKINFKSLFSFSIIKILKDYGANDFKEIDKILSKLFKKKNISNKITFKELYDLTGIELITTTVCLNYKDVCYMSYKNFPSLRVITATLMSSSIPIYFTPIKLNNNLYIDGACYDGFPIKLFDKNKYDILGICIATDEKYYKIDNFKDLIIAFYKNIVNGINKNNFNEYKEVIIRIKCPKLISFFSLKLEKKNIEELFDCGYNTGLKFIKKKYKKS